MSTSTANLSATCIHFGEACVTNLLPCTATAHAHSLRVDVAPHYSSISTVVVSWCNATLLEGDAWVAIVVALLLFHQAVAWGVNKEESVLHLGSSESEVEKERERGRDTASTTLNVRELCRTRPCGVAVVVVPELLPENVVVAINNGQSVTLVGALVVPWVVVHQPVDAYVKECERKGVGGLVVVVVLTCGW